MDKSSRREKKGKATTKKEREREEKKLEMKRQARGVRRGGNGGECESGRIRKMNQQVRRIA